MKSPCKVFFKVIGVNLLSIMLKQTNRIVLLPVKPSCAFFIGARGSLSHASRCIATNYCQSQLNVKQKHPFQACSIFVVLCSSNVKMPSCSDKAATTVASTLISLAVASSIFFLSFSGALKFKLEVPSCFRHNYK